MVKMIHFSLCNEGSILLMLKCSFKKVRIATVTVSSQGHQAYPMTEMGEGGGETNLAYVPVFLSKLK